MKNYRNALIIAAAGALALFVAGCDDSETIAPEGSTIDLNFNPAQVILAGTPPAQVNPITVVATVRNSIGVPLPGQDVRFTTTSGQLTPPALQPITTDDLGNASCELSVATTGPTITATSGKATVSKALNSANGEVAQVIINSDAFILENCSDTFEITAQALDGAGVGVSGFTLILEVTNGATGGWSFSPAQGITDTSGEVVSTLSPSSCGNDCVGTGKVCTVRIRATSNGGLIVSTDIQIEDQIP